MGGINSSSVSARLRLTQQSYHFCRQRCLSRAQSAQLRLQSLLGLHEQGKRAAKRIVNPQVQRELTINIPRTPSVVSP